MRWARQGPQKASATQGGLFQKQRVKYSGAPATAQNPRVPSQASRMPHSNENTSCRASFEPWWDSQQSKDVGGKETHLSSALSIVSRSLSVSIVYVPLYDVITTGTRIIVRTRIVIRTRVATVIVGEYQDKGSPSGQGSSSTKGSRCGEQTASTTGGGMMGPSRTATLLIHTFKRKRDSATTRSLRSRDQFPCCSAACG